MRKSAPARSGMVSTWLGRVAGLAWILAIGLSAATAHAQGDGALRLEAIEVQPLPGQQVELKLKLNGPAPQPMSFTIENPARISLDLPNTTLGLSSRRQEANIGPLTSILTAEANGRTRVVLNLNQMVPYDTRVEGDSVYVRIGQSPGAAAAPAFAAQPAPSPRGGATAPAATTAATDRSIRNIDFRRGANGAGQIVVDLQNTSLPQELMRRLDVTDFATPVFTVDALRANRDARLVVTAAAD